MLDNTILDNTMKAQLKAYLEKLTRPVELVSTLDDSAKSGEIRTLLQEIAALSPKITVREDNSTGARKPSFLIVNPDRLRVSVLPVPRWVMNSLHWC